MSEKLSLAMYIPLLMRLPPLPLTITLTLLIVAVPLILYLNARPSPPAHAPLSKGNLPVFGAVDFFRKRQTFCARAARESPNGIYSFYVGKELVIGVSGPAARKGYFESKDLNFGMAYTALLGMGPRRLPEKLGGNDQFQAIGNRLARLLRTSAFTSSVPDFISITQTRLHELACLPSNSDNTIVFDPFDHIYSLIFNLTIRAITSQALALDRPALAHLERVADRFDTSHSPLGIIFPSLPTPGKLKRSYAGIRLFLALRTVVEARRKHPISSAEPDPLQFLLDEGISDEEIITFIIGSIFAGILNSGVNAAASIAYLACHPTWMAQARAEVEAVVVRPHRSSTPSDTDTDTDPVTADPLDLLSRVPLPQWESPAVFPVLTAIFDETMRLNVLGASFRYNPSPHAIPLGDTGVVVPPRAFAALHFSDHHMDPALFPTPLRFDPARPALATGPDKATKYDFTPWGTGRHPCLGMRLARVEQTMVLAGFLLAFDAPRLETDKGALLDRPPDPALDAYSAVRWRGVRVRCRVREGVVKRGA